MHETPLDRTIGRNVRAHVIARPIALRPLSPIPYPLSLFATTLLAALTLLALPAHAADYPKLQSGLWEMQRSSDRPDAQPNRATMCLDDKVQKELFDLAGAMQGTCSKHEFRFTGNRGRGDFVCTMGGSTMRSKSTMVVEGGRSYRTEIDTTYDPPLMGHAHMKTVITARHVGACKAGQRPGDLVLPNGQTMNMHDVLAGARSGHGVAGTIQPGARKPAPQAPK